MGRMTNKNAARTGQLQVSVRHGQSAGTENLFTGWTDVDSRPRAAMRRKQRAVRSQDAGPTFDIAFTSALVR
jgi:2,3-bisphosphoglycerate-dependent phosphoglycerate mutase